MTYVTKYCPKCGKVYERFATKGKRYGSPLIKCASCGCMFFDRDVIEPACEDSPGSPSVKSGCSAYISIFMGGFLAFVSAYALYLSFTDHSSDDSWIFVFMLLFGIIMFVLGIRHINYELRYKESDAMNTPEYIESLKRMSNPEYALLLHQHGFHVPDRFLLTAEQIALLKSRQNNT